MKITFDFIPLSERFPEKSEKYLTLTKNSCTDFYFSCKYLAFNAFDFFDEETARNNCLNDRVIAWAEIPQEIEDWRKAHDENV